MLKDVGVQANKEDLAAMLKALSGKKLHDLVRDGSKKLASIPSGGASAGASAAPATTVAAPAKKEEKPKEEEAADVDLGGLFGDDGY